MQEYNLHKMLEYSYIYTFYRIFRFDVKLAIFRLSFL